MMSQSTVKNNKFSRPTANWEGKILRIQNFAIDKRPSGRTMITRAALLLGVASFPALASAQNAESIEAEPMAANTEGEAQNDIIVTALKRSISVQDTPVTVNLVQGEVFEKANITSTIDLPAVTPGVLIQISPAGFPIAAIRGIGSNPSNQSFDQSVALFVNGVFAPRGRDYASSLFDIADVQVVKGGQSAILGKNTTIGALVLTTRRPAYEFGFSASYTHELELGSDTIDAAVNVPFGDKFAIRMAARTSNQEGWQRNDLLNEDSPVTKTRAGRISARWEPFDNFEWNASYQKERYKVTGQVLYAGGDAGALKNLALLAGDPKFTAQLNDHYRASPRPGFGPDEITNNSERVVSDMSLDFGAGFTLTSLFGYLHSSGTFLTNFDAIINAPFYFFSDRAGGDTYSQEVRISSPRMGMFEFVAGGLYYHDKYGMDFGADAVFPIPVTGAEVTTFDQTTESWSGFGAVTAYITDAFRFNGALRYTSEDRSADYTRQVIRGGALVAAIFRPFPPTTLSRSSTNWDYSASLSYDFLDNAMAYASYGRGTKSGGFANNPNDPRALRPDGTRAPEFDDEVAKTIEIGVKWGRAAGTHLNFALYHIDIDGYQTSLFSGINFIVRNQDARSKGFEIDAAYQLMEGLRFSVNTTYADAYNRNPIGTDRARLTRAPKWSGIASINYANELASGWTLSADANAEFRSKLYFTDIITSPTPPSDKYVKLGLRLGIEDSNSGLGIALIGRNLTDKRIISFATNAFPGLPAFVASTEPPRTIAIQVSYRH